MTIAHVHEVAQDVLLAGVAVGAHNVVQLPVQHFDRQRPCSYQIERMCVSILEAQESEERCRFVAPQLRAEGLQQPTMLHGRADQQRMRAFQRTGFVSVLLPAVVLEQELHAPAGNQEASPTIQTGPSVSRVRHGNRTEIDELSPHTKSM